ncbi:MAG: SUF system NifU family Fe-S cluster assembly protein [Planctomycetes bacterium]|nr:SUF system NifU family Fe-S cluster assembly protein [Planctomycetota bacterium]MCC7170481.1 SUF system NifU family Fe-S cluster assembly protein [Planctomycetota bacterium]
MSDLRDLYQDLILDHGKKPRNFRKDDACTHHAEGFNPLCGDQIALFLRVSQDGKVEDACFQGKGCAISTASASMMTAAVKGMTVEEARRLFVRFRDLITGVDPSTSDSELGKLAVFDGIREYPNRIKCAALPWHALTTALDGNADPVSTE